MHAALRRQPSAVGAALASPPHARRPCLLPPLLLQVFAPFIDVMLYPTPRLLDFYEASMRGLAGGRAGWDWAPPPPPPRVTSSAAHSMPSRPGDTVQHAPAPARRCPTSPPQPRSNLTGRPPGHPWHPTHLQGAGQKWFTLAFITADQRQLVPAWGGVVGMDKQVFVDQVRETGRGRGGLGCRVCLRGLGFVVGRQTCAPGRLLHRPP